jgi:hypothetical protein
VIFPFRPPLQKNHPLHPSKSSFGRCSGLFLKVRISVRNFSAICGEVGGNRFPASNLKPRAKRSSNRRPGFGCGQGAARGLSRFRGAVAPRNASFFTGRHPSVKSCSTELMGTPRKVGRGSLIAGKVSEKSPSYGLILREWARPTKSGAHARKSLRRKSGDRGHRREGGAWDERPLYVRSG